MMTLPIVDEQMLDRLRAAPLASEIEFLAARARSIGSAIASDLLSELGLRVRSYAVLALACDDLKPTQRELAEFLRLDPSQIVALVDDLERGGYVRRVVAAGDRRSRVITGTPEGRDLYRRASALTRRAEDIALAPLTAAERDALRDLMAKIAFLPDPPTA